MRMDEEEWKLILSLAIQQQPCLECFDPGCALARTVMKVADHHHEREHVGTRDRDRERDD